MIIRETRDHFIMIEQHNHAKLSEKIMTYWKNNIEGNLSSSVLTAIKLHDYGWKYFDKQPIWNDQTNSPYDFISYPLAPKTVVYTHGINEVERLDKYAALLCSVHYTSFLKNESSIYAKQFVNQEKARQKQIIQRLNDFDKDIFDYHYELLKFADSLSLFLCIHEPGVKQNQFHPFFKQGISVPTIDKTLIPIWQDKETILLDPFPFTSEMKIQIEQKVIAKHEINQKGIIKSYEEAPYERMELKLAKK